MIKKASVLIILLLLISNNFIDASQKTKKLGKTQSKTETETEGIITGMIVSFVAGKAIGALTKALGDNTKAAGVLEFLGLYDSSERKIAESVKRIEEKVKNIAMNLMNLIKNVDNADLEHKMFNRNNFIRQNLYPANLVFEAAEDIRQRLGSDEEVNLSEELKNEILIWGRIHSDDVGKIIREMMDKQNGKTYPDIYYQYGLLALNKEETIEFVNALMLEDVDCIYKNLILTIGYFKIRDDFEDNELMEDFQKFLEFYDKESEKYQEK